MRRTFVYINDEGYDSVDIIYICIYGRKFKNLDDHPAAANFARKLVSLSHNRSQTARSDHSQTRSDQS